ncbi:MAG: ABC transporter substrate-binding protein [Rhodopirellula sp.]|nr:ABC transporter substrate-binding protein [Rhodopirellula sp.]
MGMVFPVSTHDYELRYWLAASGIHTDFYTRADIGGRTDAGVELPVRKSLLKPDPKTQSPAQ